jgi:hypothetical protein
MSEGRRSRRYRVPVKGPNGKPDNLMRHIASALGRETPGVFVVRVQHDTGCPAVPNGPTDACTCETVNVELDQS